MVLVNGCAFCHVRFGRGALGGIRGHSSVLCLRLGRHRAELPAGMFMRRGSPLQACCEGTQAGSGNALLCEFGYETGWLPRVLVLIAVGYALSPIDLIPDCIPVLGLVDDFLILPILLWLARRLVPAAVLERARMRQELEPSLILPSSLGAAIFVGLLWLAAAEAVSAWLANAFSLPQRQQLVAMLSMGLVFTGVYCMVIERIIRDRKPGVAEPSAGDYHMMPPPPPDVPL